MTTYTVLPQDDQNLEVTVTDPALAPELQDDSDLDVVVQESLNPVVINITPAAVSITSAVLSVNGATGNVTLDTDDIGEGSSNLYYTESRATINFDSNFLAADTDDLTEGLNNLYYTSARANADFDSRLATKDTDDVAEGNNLYYTDARANSAIDARVDKAFVDNLNVDSDTLDGQQGSHYLDYNNFTNTPTIPSNNNELTNGAAYIKADSSDTLTNKSGNISQWTNDAGYITSETDSQSLAFSDPNLTISNGNTVDISAINNIISVNGATGTVTLDTDDISEGANLYYTDARANSAIDARVTGSFIDALDTVSDGGTY